MKKDFLGRVERSFASVRAFAGHRPDTGIILGSGLGRFARELPGADVPFRTIREFPHASVKGHEGSMKIGARAVVCAGRFHYYEGHSLDSVVLPVFLMHRMGVRTLVVTNAAGAVNPGYAAGELVLIYDHINLTGVNPLVGPNIGELGERFPDMGAAYDAELRNTARALDPLLVHEGVYAGLSGPSYETPAEIRMLHAMGADMVGMSTVPEVIAARFLGMRVLGISCVTNTVSQESVNHDGVLAASERAAERLCALSTGFLARNPSA